MNKLMGYFLAFVNCWVCWAIGWHVIPDYHGNTWWAFPLVVTLVLIVAVGISAAISNDIERREKN